MEHDIRVDQSHCNIGLANALADLGWVVVFRDPGRASRGHTGTQSIVHSVFTRNGWPIPDIVAWQHSAILLVEVDRYVRQARDSASRYIASNHSILRALVEALDLSENTNNLIYGFCRTGTSKISPKLHSEAAQVGFTMLAYFTGASDLTIEWNLQEPV